jgi:hypothetical protein
MRRTGAHVALGNLNSANAHGGNIQRIGKSTARIRQHFDIWQFHKADGEASYFGTFQIL